jgi:hypothetical protein
MSETGNWRNRRRLSFISKLKCSQKRILISYSLICRLIVANVVLNVELEEADTYAGGPSFSDFSGGGSGMRSIVSLRSLYREIILGLVSKILWRD